MAPFNSPDTWEKRGRSGRLQHLTRVCEGVAHFTIQATYYTKTRESTAFHREKFPLSFIMVTGLFSVPRVAFCSSTFPATFFRIHPGERDSSIRSAESVREAAGPSAATDFGLSAGRLDCSSSVRAGAVGSHRPGLCECLPSALFRSTSNSRNYHASLPQPAGSSDAGKPDT
jgi:hypothetical protein